MGASTPARGSASGTVTIVTGPAGVDVGPVAARLGQSLGDGLAIRTVVSDGPECPHDSPNPYAIRHHASAAEYTGPQAVALAVLPSAWQNPDTNLGVAYTGLPVGLPPDLEQLDIHGLNPGHRVTVQHRSNYRAGSAIPIPVEIGDLAAQARDSVLRTGGRVLIEAGDGQTAQEALHTVGLPPWSACIGRLDIWIVLNAQLALDRMAGLDEAGTHAREYLLYTAATEVRRNGGPPRDIDNIGPVNIWLAVLDTHLLPGLDALAGLDETVDDGEPLPHVDQDTRQAIGDLLDAFRDKADTFPTLLGTGWPPGGPAFLDLLGNHVDTPAN